MASLRDDIQALRCLSADLRSYFVPTGALNNLLKTETIKSTFRNTKVQPDRQEEVIKRVEHGGRRTFAILVTIYKPHRIIDFIERDELQRASLDSKLPFGLADLQTFLPGQEAVDFFDKQWEFTAPVFSRRAGHRTLHQRTIFPFISSKEHGEGSFGAVYLVNLHPNHGRILGVSEDNNLFVRKQLKATSSSEPNEFERERRVLSFLNYLEHPNIIELIGSYTWNGVHNLLFPLAASDLHQFLRSGNHPDFKSEGDYLLALCGLTSALDTLHSFFSEDLDIRLIGCHHDLKPRNVLVQDGKFLLTDFGLSTFKEVADGSKTLFKARDSEYAAPECDDPEHDFERGIIGRKSDMWSLGCIISEVLTYVVRGVGAIGEFRTNRKVTVGGRFTSSAFHAGSEVNKGVQLWLTQLEAKASSTGRDVAELVKRILQIEPEMRPSAEQVTLDLRYLALKSNFQTVYNLYNSVKNQSTLDMLIEKDRFNFWGYTLGLDDFKSQKIQATDSLRSETFFHRQYQNISKIGEELAIESRTQNDIYARVIRLRMINDDVLSGLPHAFQLSINEKLEQKIVNTEDMDLLKEIKATFQESSKYRSMGTLAAIKYMHRLCQAPPTSFKMHMHLTSVSWKPEKAHDEDTKAHFVLGTLIAKEQPEEIYVLVEKIEYEEHWVGSIGDELLSRVGAIVELLRISASSENGIRVLLPVGYFHEPANRLFRIVSSIPTDVKDSKGQRLEVVTLRRYIDETYKMILSRPSLNNRLDIARHLASDLAKIHKAGWLHKNISAFSIIFTLPKERHDSTYLPLPYIVGFNYSRPNDPKGFSQKSHYSVEVRDYRHPEYLKDPLNTRYRAQFDYFSLGLVLLEIGLWRPLNRMTKGKVSSPAELLQHLLKEWVPHLDFFGGNAYREVVTRCLQGDVHPGLSEEDMTRVDSTSMSSALTVEEQLKTITV